MPVEASTTRSRNVFRAGTPSLPKSQLAVKATDCFRAVAHTVRSCWKPSGPASGARLPVQSWSFALDHAMAPVEHSSSWQSVASKFALASAHGTDASRLAFVEHAYPRQVSVSSPHPKLVGMAAIAPMPAARRAQNRRRTTSTTHEACAQRPARSSSGRSGGLGRSTRPRRLRRQKAVRARRARRSSCRPNACGRTRRGSCSGRPGSTRRCPAPR